MCAGEARSGAGDRDRVPAEAGAVAWVAPEWAQAGGPGDAARQAWVPAPRRVPPRPAGGGAPPHVISIARWASSRLISKDSNYYVATKIIIILYIKAEVEIGR